MPHLIYLDAHLRGLGYQIAMLQYDPTRTVLEVTWEEGATEDETIYDAIDAYIADPPLTGTALQEQRILELEDCINYLLNN